MTTLLCCMLSLALAEPTEAAPTEAAPTEAPADADVPVAPPSEGDAPPEALPDDAAPAAPPPEAPVEEAPAPAPVPVPQPPAPEAPVFTGPPLPPGIPPVPAPAPVQVVPVPAAPAPTAAPIHDDDGHDHGGHDDGGHDEAHDGGAHEAPTPEREVVVVPATEPPPQLVRIVPVEAPVVDVGPPVPPPPPAWDALLPSIPQRGWSRTLALVLAAAGCLVLAGVARRAREGLRQGLLHSLLAVCETAARSAVALAGIVFVAQVIPRTLLPLLPWALLAGAAAAGWSLRDALPDLVAWAQLASEGALRSGQWVMGEGFSGRVVHRGLRATWLDDGRGHRVAIPNRQLVNRPVATDHERWPVVEVQLTLPERSAETVRSALTEACLLSPWVAPRPELHIAWSPDQPERWILRVRLLEGGFADRFRGALRERALDVLDQRRTRRTLEA